MFNKNKSVVDLCLILCVSLLLWTAGLHLSVFFVFVSMVPSLVVLCSKHLPLYKFGFFFLSNVLFVALGTSWFFQIYSITSALVIFSLLALMLLFPYLVASLLGNTDRTKLILFVVTWILMEYATLRFDFLSPFYILGHCFWNKLELIQFYEFTGVLGGSLWILSVNVIFFWGMKYIHLLFKCAFLGSLVIVLPSLYSAQSYKSSEEISSENVDVLLFHVNDSCLQRLDQPFLSFIKDQVDAQIPSKTSKTSFVLLPENTLRNHYRLENMHGCYDIFFLQKLMTRHKNSIMLVGAEVEEGYDNFQNILTYNSAVKLTGKDMEIVSKTNLIPFEERIPSLFGVGSENDYAIKETKHYIDNNGVRAGVLICYDALFGQYVADVASNAGFLMMLAKETSIYPQITGLKQYLGISRMRAVEQRKYLVKSSNTGYTAVIDHKGRLVYCIEPQEKSRADLLLVPLNYNKTFYAKFGDYIGVMALLVVVIFMFKKCYIKFHRSKIAVNNPSKLTEECM